MSLLNEHLAALVKKNPGRIVVFFDEFQWLCEMKPGLVSTFKYHWDNFFSKYPSCVFILCGSGSSFIVKKVIQSRALYGRVDLCADPGAKSTRHNYGRNSKLPILGGMWKSTRSKSR